MPAVAPAFHMPWTHTKLPSFYTPQAELEHLTALMSANTAALGHGYHCKHFLSEFKAQPCPGESSDYSKVTFFLSVVNNTDISTSAFFFASSSMRSLSNSATDTVSSFLLPGRLCLNRSSAPS
jgi:hypothetical protein